MDPLRVTWFLKASSLSVGVMIGESMPSASKRFRSAPLSLRTRTIPDCRKAGAGACARPCVRPWKSLAASMKALNVAEGIRSGSPGWTFLSESPMAQVPIPSCEKSPSS